MTILKNIEARQSIGTQLIKKVLLLYVICALLLTSIHMYMEYRRVKSDLTKELAVLYHTFDKPLSLAVWDADNEQLMLLVDGLVSSHLISGVSVYEMGGGHIYSKGDVFNHDPIQDTTVASGARLVGSEIGKHFFGYQYPISYSESGQPKQLGHVDLFASESIILNKLKVQLLYIFVAALLKTCVLWLVFLWYSRRMLTRPLTNFALQASRISMDRLEPVILDRGAVKHNEIKSLQIAFNEMVLNLKTGVLKQKELYYALDVLRQNLEIDVLERTEDLRKTNIDLLDQIAERKEAENKAIRYSRILQESLNEIFVFDCENFQFLYVNDGAFKNLGYSQSEILLLTPVDIKPDFTIDDFKKKLAPLLTGEQERVIFETRHQRKDQSIYNAEVHVQKMVFPEGDVFVALILDVSEKRVLEDRLRQSQKMESIGTLAGGIAHDFNNILSAIIGFAELARDDASKGSEQEGNLTEVVAAGHRAKDLVKQILAFARKSDETLKPVRFGSLVKDVLKLLRPSTPSTIEIIPEINCDSLVMGNSSQLHQVVLNLCTNAIQAMHQRGGKLKIILNDVVLENMPLRAGHIQVTDQYIEFKVIDNGAGIDTSIVEHIFEPYFTTKGVGEGSGMGLAMVKGIIETYGGDVNVISIPEETVFTVHLPISTNRGQHNRLDDVSIERGTERILFIDDELPIARMASRMLEGLGYKVTVETNSLKALEVFQTQPEQFDLVVTDMTMPFLAGDELVARMRGVRPDIPVIMCTGYSSSMDETLALNLGINALAYKPFSKVDFAKIIRNVLDSE